MNLDLSGILLKHILHQFTHFTGENSVVPVVRLPELGSGLQISRSGCFQLKVSFNLLLASSLKDTQFSEKAHKFFQRFAMFKSRFWHLLAELTR